MKPGLWEAVVHRDARFIWDKQGFVTSVTVGLPQSYWAWRMRQKVICVVPILEPQNRYPCSGKQTVDHVKDAPMMGKRAPDDLEHLVAMCEEHNVWHPPSRDLRQAERDYLRPSNE